MAAPDACPGSLPLTLVNNVDKRRSTWALLVKRLEQHYTTAVSRGASRACPRHPGSDRLVSLAGEPLMALGDRRSGVRLEVVGALWATLELAEPTRLVNISRDGALITSSVPMAPDSVQPLQLRVSGRDVTVDARVRHSRRVSGPDQPPRYLVGVEFLSIPPGLAQATDWSPV